MFRITYIEICIEYNELKKQRKDIISIWRNQKKIITNNVEEKKNKNDIEEFFETIEKHEDLLEIENIENIENTENNVNWTIKIRYNKNKIKKIEGRGSFLVFEREILQSFYKITDFQYNIQGKEYFDYKKSLKDVYSEKIEIKKVNESDVVRCYKENKSIEKTANITGYTSTEVKKCLKRAKIKIKNKEKNFAYDTGLDAKDFF